MSRRCCCGGVNSCESYIRGPTPTCFKLEFRGVGPPRADSSTSYWCGVCDCFDTQEFRLICSGSGLHHGPCVCDWYYFSEEGGGPGQNMPFCPKDTYNPAARLRFESGGGGTVKVTVVYGNWLDFEDWPFFKDGSYPAIFEKVYDSVPRVENWDQEEIPYLSGGMANDCDFSGAITTGTAGQVGSGTEEAAVALLTPLYNAGTGTGIGTALDDDCATSFHYCHRCWCKPPRDVELLLTVGGITNRSCEDGACEAFNGEFVLTADFESDIDWRDNHCRWGYAGVAEDPCDSPGVTSDYQFDLGNSIDSTYRYSRLQIFDGDTTYRWYHAKLLSDPIPYDCTNLGMTLEIFNPSQYSHCKTSDSTATITSIN